MRKTTILFLFFVALSISLSAQDNPEREMVVIRVVEARAGNSEGANAMIRITEIDGTLRIVDLDKHRDSYLVNSNENQKKIHQELKKYVQDGYEIVDHQREARGFLVWIEDYVLLKN